MGAHNTSNDVMSIQGMIYPVSNCFICGVFQSFTSTGCRHYSCTQHFHPCHIGSLSMDVFFTHVNNAFQTFQCTNGCRCNTVLTSTSFCNYSFFPKSFSKQDLTNCIINFMCTGMT